MIVTADWMVPVSGPPVRDGAVCVHGHVIGDVGTRAEITSRYPGSPVHAHPGCVLIPGLVNAHTHLSLTALSGLVPPMRFDSWLAEVAPIIRDLSHDDLAASATMGAHLCISAGVTVVGDVTYGAESLPAAWDVGVSGLFFWEVLGMSPAELPAFLERMEFPLDPDDAPSGRSQCGLTPHAPYSSGPGLIRAVSAFARKRSCAMMMHLAESRAEIRLLAAGEGPLAPVTARLAHDFQPPRTGAVRYADSLGVLEGMIAVHCAHLASGEAELLAEKARGVVLCPGSNSYLGSSPAPVAELRSLGANLAMGSDSLASNTAIDLFKEARALRTIDPELSPQRLMEILTLEGATVLGLDSLFGSLETGKQADLTIIEIGTTADPVADLISFATPGHIRAVMSMGGWRMLEGRPASPISRIEQENARVVAKAAQSRDAHHATTRE